MKGRNSLTESNTTLTLARNLLLDILDGVSREDILRKIASYFVSRLNLDRCCIFLFDEEGNYLKSEVNYVNGEFVKLDIIFLLDDTSLVVNCFKEGKTIVAENAETHPITSKELVQKFGDKTLFAVPVLVRDKRIGVAILGWTDELHSVSADELAQAKEISELLGIVLSLHIIMERERVNRRRAVEFQRIIDELYRMSEIIQRVSISERLREILLKAKNAIGFDRINVFVSSPDGRWLECIASTEQDVIVDPIKIPLDERGGGLSQSFLKSMDVYFNGIGNLPHELRIKKPYSEIGAIRSRNFIITPIIMGKETIGVIGADNKFSKRPIGPDSIEILKIFASYVAYTIENYRLFEKTLEEKREWSETFDAIEDPIFIVDAEYRILKANTAFIRKTGLSKEDALLKRCYNVFCKRESPLDNCPLTLFLKDQGRRRSEFELDMDERSYVVSIFPIIGKQGIAERFIHVAKDITDYKKLREELFHAEKMASMGRLLSSISHEINNPLTSIIGFAYILTKDEEDESRRAFLEVIKKEAERAAKICKDLLLMGRKEREEKTRGNINDILGEIVKLRTYHWGINNITVHCDLDTSVTDTIADFHRLRQAFFNIILNAEDAIKEHKKSGNIRIKTRHDPLNGKINIEISDDGCGIPAPLLSKIFEPFFTTKDVGKGTGLGLSLSHYIIKQHGGDIHVTSQPGEGSTFFITLPLQK